MLPLQTVPPRTSIFDTIANSLVNIDEITMYLYPLEYISTWCFIGFMFCWGISSLVYHWDSFEEKLINTLIVIGSIIYLMIFLGRNSDSVGETLVLLSSGILALGIGSFISYNVDDDWHYVAMVIGVLSLIAMFILLCLDI